MCEMTGLSLGKLGESVGFSDETLPRIIREARKGNRRYPGSGETFGLLADKYNLLTDWLMGRIESPMFLGEATLPPARGKGRT